MNDEDKVNRLAADLTSLAIRTGQSYIEADAACLAREYELISEQNIALRDQVICAWNEITELRAENKRLLTLIAEGAEFVTMFTYNDGYIHDQDTIDEAKAWLAKATAADALRGED